MTRGTLSKTIFICLALVSLPNEPVQANPDETSRKLMSQPERLAVISKMRSICRNKNEPVACVTKIASKPGNPPSDIVFDYALLECSFKEKVVSCMYVANKAADENDFTSAFGWIDAACRKENYAGCIIKGIWLSGMNSSDTKIEAETVFRRFSSEEWLEACEKRSDRVIEPEGSCRSTYRSSNVLLGRLLIEMGRKSDSLVYFEKGCLGNPAADCRVFERKLEGYRKGKSIPER
jgi:hypothetical protein